MAKDTYKSQGDSDSPLATRRGNADPVVSGADEVTAKTGEFDYDKNTLPTGVEPDSFAPSH
jgi:hypothetical protein